MFSLCLIFSEIILSFRMFVHVFTSDRYWIIWYIYHHLTKPYGITIFFTSNLNMLSCFYYTNISDRYSLNRRVLTWSTNTRVLDYFIVIFPSVINRRLTYLLNNIKKKYIHMQCIQWISFHEIHVSDINHFAWKILILYMIIKIYRILTLSKFYLCSSLKELPAGVLIY